MKRFGRTSANISYVFLAKKLIIKMLLKVAKSGRKR